VKQGPTLRGRGLLVVVEGIDGAGKSTIVQELAAHCTREGVSFVVSREPTNGQWGALLRQSAASGRLSLEEELDLFIKDRHEHVGDLIAPALRCGKVVVLDRYYFSTAAYQGARGGDVDAIIRTNQKFAPPPDLVLLLDVDPAASGDRIRARGNELDQFEAREYQAKVRAIYLRLKDPAIRVVDAMRPAELVFRDCLAHFTRMQNRSRDAGAR
jgi:dTMP kinase